MKECTAEAVWIWKACEHSGSGEMHTFFGYRIGTLVELTVNWLNDAAVWLDVAAAWVDDVAWGWMSQQHGWLTQQHGWMTQQHGSSMVG